MALKLQKSTLVKKGSYISKTLLFKSLLKHAGTIIYNPKKVNDLFSKANKKLKKYQNIKTLRTEISNPFVLFYEMIRARIKGEYPELKSHKIILIIAVTIYFVIPTDLIPDFIIPFGLIDDFSLLAWLFKTLKNEINLFSAWKKNKDSIKNIT